MMFSNGDKIGPYTVRETAGQGGMATVYKAWHDGLHRFEALKVPRGAGGAAPDSAYIQRLLAEARVAAGLHHPHIVAIHGVSEPFAPIPFFAMDWVEGRDLAKILGQKGAFSLPETTQILSGVAAALDYAHQNGVVHRDIKPANILIGEQNGVWVPKVVDFGISRAAEDDDGEGATKLTKSGMIVGTPEYMSPEQAGSGEVIDYRTDIYSLAVLAYEMLCGCPPFTAGAGVSRLSVLISHVRDAAPLFDRWPDFPREAGTVILRALSKSPAQRPISCTAFIQELEAATPKNWPQFSPQNAGTERTPFDSSGFQSSDVATICASPSSVSQAIPEVMAQTPTSATYSLRARLEAANKTPLPEPAVAQTKLDVVAAQTRVDMPVPALTSTHVPLSESISTAPPRIDSLNVAGKPRMAPRIVLLAGLGGIFIGAAAVFTLFGRNSGENAIAATTQARPPVVLSPRPVPIAAKNPVAANQPRRRTVSETQTREIAFKTIEQRSNSRSFGSSSIKQPGKKGMREVTFSVVLEGEKEISRRAVAQRVTREPISRIVVIGTRRGVIERAPRSVIAPPAPRVRSRRIVREAPRRVVPKRVIRPRIVARPVVRRAPRKIAPRVVSRPQRRVVREAPLPP
ncbi:MAG TPA: protein kinase [Abditibacterium sp.]|jgi:serine/threonine protein kinase